MAVSICLEAGCGRMISLSALPGGNPVALANPERWAVLHAFCGLCGRCMCDRCIARRGLPVSELRCVACGGHYRVEDLEKNAAIVRGSVEAAWQRKQLARVAEIFVSVVTWAEIEHGIGLTEEAFQNDLRPWLAGVRAQFALATLPLDEAVLVRWKRLLSDLKARNRTVTCEDSLIAATALHFDHTVLSGNTAHFLPTGVRVLNPLEYCVRGRNTPSGRPRCAPA